MNIVKYAVFVITLGMTYFEPIHGLLLLVAILFTVDFVTGFIKSVKTTHAICVKSKRLRWSAVKMCVYLSIMALTFFICRIMGIELDATLSVIKIEVWCIVYIEGLSIVENLQVIFPNDKFFSMIHELLAIEFLKYIPILSSFLKEKEDENREINS
ncbi:MAG: phage holin family protein [Prevotellaceae bacterium]|nr:phage holin family protein [Prevotellaceae bacterium]